MDELFWTILNDATQSLVAGRIYWAQAPQTAKTPFIVLNVISSVDSPHMQGAGGFWQYRVQVDSYGNDRPSARRLSRTVRQEINGTVAGEIQLILFDAEREMLEGAADGPRFRFSQDYIVTWRPEHG